MAEFNVTTKVESLRTLMTQMKHAYWYNTPNKAVSTIGAIDIELPVLEDGVSFNTGEADVSRIKLTTGDTWVSKAEAGDADITFQVSSVNGVVNDLLMTKTVSTKATTTATFDGKTYEGYGYSLAPKKVVGGLLLTGEPGETMVFFPNVELYASLVLEDGDNPSYYNVVVTPLNDDNGAAFYPLTPSEGNG